MSAWEGSAWQRQNELRREREKREKRALANKPQCRGSYSLGTACGRCFKCKYTDPSRPGAKLPPAKAKPPSVGKRSHAVMLTVHDIATLVGAGPNATVEVVGQSSDQPQDDVVLVKWQE